MVVLRRSEVEIRYFPMLATEDSLDAYQFYVSVGLKTASLRIATVRAVPWREHADEAVENRPIIQNAEQFSFRRARATHDPYHIASRLETFLFSRSIARFN